MFEDFCRKNNLDTSWINGIMDSYGNIQGLIDAHNELKPRSNKEVMEMLVAEEENRYIRKLIEVVFNIVKALQNVSRIKFYGMTVFCEVLCGAENKRIRDNRLDKIPEYGIYKSLSVDEVRTVVDWMISEHYILKTRGKYPVLHSTYEGLHYSESITEGKLKKLKKRLEGNKMPFDI